MLKRRIKLFFFLLLLLLVQSIASLSADEYQFKWDVKAGETYRYRIDTNQDINQILNKSWISITAFYSMEIELMVEKVAPEGDTHIRVTFKRIVQSQKRGNEKIFEFDTSAGGDVPNSQKGVYALINENFAVVFNKLAKVTEVTGTDTIIENIRNKLSKEISDEVEREQMLLGIKNMFNSESIKEMMANVNLFPEKPIKVGSSWQIETKNKSNFPITIHSTYTLNSLNQEKGLVSVVSDVQTEEGGSRFNVGSMQLNYNLRGRQKGEISFDARNSFLMSMQMQQSIFGKVFIEGNSALAPWPISIVSDITFTLLK